ncbi:MAG: NUDIX domain-containing protein [Bacteroidales bacterium]
MYKVFFNDNFLQITATEPTEKNIEIKSYAGPAQVDEWIACAKDSKSPLNWSLMTEEVQQAWEQLLNHLPIIEAAGGVVQNPVGKYLFIYRRKRWDLPKGKMDAGETPHQTALREVEEETGLSPLHILKFLTHTYHIYWLKDRFTLKRTHWYLMNYSGDKPPVPQTSEDIERIEWMTIEEFKLVKEPVFGTVIDVIETLRTATII